MESSGLCVLREVDGVLADCYGTSRAGMSLVADYSVWKAVNR